MPYDNAFEVGNHLSRGIGGSNEVVSTTHPAKVRLGWETVHLAVETLALMATPLKPRLIVGIARGGLIPATLLSHQLNIPLKVVHAQSYEGTRRNLMKPTEVIGLTADMMNHETIFVDDILDSGETRNAIARAISAPHMFVLVSKRPEWHKTNFFATVPKDVWVEFPWESKS